MGLMKRLHTARICRAKGKSRKAPKSAPKPQPAPRESVKLRKCECGCRQFALRFQMAALRYTILADCTDCGASRVISLNEAHQAKQSSNKKKKAGKRDLARRSGPRRRPLRRKAAVSDEITAPAGFGRCRDDASPARQTPGRRLPNPGSVLPDNLVDARLAKLPADASRPISHRHQ
jgi:hypothetical protein